MTTGSPNRRFLEPGKSLESLGERGGHLRERCDDGLDEGPILMQKSCDIGADETLGDIYFKKLFPMGVDAMIESLDLLKDGNAPKIVQNLDGGSYESWFGKKQAKIDWNQSASDIYNIIRAGNPQPGAWTTHGDVEVKVFDSEKIDASGQPGEVVAIDENGFVVVAAQGAIRIKRVRADGGKVLAPEYVETSGLQIGDMLGG